MFEVGKKWRGPAGGGLCGEREERLEEGGGYNTSCIFPILCRLFGL